MEEERSSERDSHNRRYKNKRERKERRGVYGMLWKDTTKFAIEGFSPCVSPWSRRCCLDLATFSFFTFYYWFVLDKWKELPVRSSTREKEKERLSFHLLLLRWALVFLINYIYGGGGGSGGGEQSTTLELSSYNFWFAGSIPPADSLAILDFLSYQRWLLIYKITSRRWN